MLRKLGQNYQIALPKEIVRDLHLNVNDYVDIRVQNNEIILEPQVVIPKDQAYFYTPQWQGDEQKASEDIAQGRVTKTKGVKELFKKLEQGQDAELVKIWLKIADTSLKEFQKIYERLGIKYDLFLGESFYRNKTEAIIKKCLAKKIAVLEKDGPVVVDLAGFGLASYILRKSDEATIYAARALPMWC